MIIPIIGMIALGVLLYMGNDFFKSKDLRSKEEDLSDLKDKEVLLDIEDSIVSKEILLKKRADKLQKEKEKLK